MWSEIYDEEIFKILFEITNRIEIRRIHFKLFLSEEDLKSLFAQIRSLDAENMISDKVSLFAFRTKLLIFVFETKNTSVVNIL